MLSISKKYIRRKNFFTKVKEQYSDEIIESIVLYSQNIEITKDKR